MINISGQSQQISLASAMSRQLIMFHRRALTSNTTTLLLQPHGRHQISISQLEYGVKITSGSCFIESRWHGDLKEKGDSIPTSLNIFSIKLS